MSHILSTELERAREQLRQRFNELGIPAPTIPYPASQTVEEGKRLRGEMKGTFTKNLLLKDKKNNLFLLAFHEDRNLNLKTLHKLIGASGRLGFASADVMQELLGLVPGALTPLGLINDRQNKVTVIIDAALMGDEQINFHPLINTESTGLHPQELLTFIRSCGREAQLIDFDGQSSSVTKGL